MYEPLVTKIFVTKFIFLLSGTFSNYVMMKYLVTIIIVTKIKLNFSDNFFITKIYCSEIVGYNYWIT